MENWQTLFKYDPLPPLLAAPNEALRKLVRRDLLVLPVELTASPEDVPEVRKTLKRQRPDGSWPHPGKPKHPAINPHLIETWRWLRILVDQYALTRQSPPVEKAAHYLFSCQTAAGDFRGVLANQYATYYSGAILATLIEAGYANDARVEACFQWLLSMRQDDGGWSVPLITHKFDRQTQYRLTTQFADPVEPDRAKPFSHNWTGMVLRAFAAHPHYRTTQAAKHAAALLKSRFFQADVYSSYQSPQYWLRFEYPFWWNNLVAALDTISLIGVPKEDEHVQPALSWFIDHQEPGGLWKASYMPAKVIENARTKDRQTWVSLAICRIFKRYFD